MAANSQDPAYRAKRVALLNYFSLFSSFSTLSCCALPSVVVLWEWAQQWHRWYRRLHG